MEQNDNGDDDARRLQQLTRSLLMKPGELADALNVGRSTAYHLLASGQIPCLKIGRSVRVPRDKLLEWIAERTQRGE